MLPFLGSLAALAPAWRWHWTGCCTLFNLLWIGRWLGIPGTLLIIGSTAYSLRKRKIIQTGNPAKLLRWHEALAWLGSLLVLVHAGVHFNAILGWLAVWAMLINVGSGLTGKFLLERARRRMEQTRQRLRERGLSEVDLEDRLHWDSLTFDVVKQWRVVHFRSRWPSACWRRPTSWPSCCSGAGVEEAPAAAHRHRAEPVRAGGAGLCLPAPHGEPGPLVKGHAELTTNCFACHTPWRGAASGRCVECHAVADVGLKTTKGLPIAAGTIKGSFHQALIEQDCIACHSDHQGPKLTQRSRKPFSHALLTAAVRDTCSSCHAAPQNALHRKLSAECSTCHQSTAWKPAHFDHNKHFVLDRDHQASCETCHKNNDYSTYTCYGCHEHSLASVRQEHAEEGIRNLGTASSAIEIPAWSPRRTASAQKGRKKRD